MPDDRQHFRTVMGHLPTGVTVVTSARSDGSPCGLTVNSVVSVSLDPLLVLFCIDRSAASHACIIERGAFAISVLSTDDEAIARRFSNTQRLDRFGGLKVREEVSGCPVLERALAWIDCEVVDVHEAGDHSIIVGQVLACGTGFGRPLVFLRGRYRGIVS